MIEKDAENQIRAVKRQFRRRAIDFFIQKTKDVIDVFKEEQIHIIDAYNKMRMEDTRQQITI